jgi:lambda repressor-like predicted transcriptional regulator
VHPADVKAAITKAGSSMTDIAEELGVSPQSVFHVVEGTTVSSKIRNAISQKIGIAVTEIWPKTVANDTPAQAA